MAEDEGATTQGTGTGEGKPGGGTQPGQAGKTGPGTVSVEGQPGQGKTAGKTVAPAAGTQAGTEEPTFIDPKNLPPELQAHYKEMQKAFSKKMEALSKDRAKIEAYDAFSHDPVGNLQRMAAQMGYRLTRAEAAAMAAEGQGGADPNNWEPKTWGEVIQKISQAARAGLLQELSPLIGQVTEMRKSSIEKMLDDSCPDWRTYEDEMKANIQAHPSLVNDPVKLYRISVPPEVLESRATQAALKKLEQKVKGGGTGGPSTTTRHQAATFGEKPLSFHEAVAAAKARLAEQGITAPPGA